MNKDDARRPDPDEILSRIRAESAKDRRGKLKIFFGSSAGVGKTYAMLSAAREQLEKGRDVLVGIVETHGRPETERLLEGLRILPPLEISYRGITLRELDLEAALTRRPNILLVDELAHTNAPGCRHPKRWNDVVELLEAGIDVYTTLNVQHIESLSDLVTGSTGVWMKETVPDLIFDMAEDVVLVDLDEDDLIKRLHEGKVYLAPGAKAHAADNFFKKSNLCALREMALRRVAERVDAEREATAPMGEEKQSVPIAEKILVCIALNELSARLLRTTRRMAGALRAPWTALFVDDSGLSRLPEDKARYLENLERMIENMGGKAAVVRGRDVADEVIAYAQRNHFSKIVVGKNFRFSLKNLFYGFVVDKIIRQSGAIDVYIVTSDREKERVRFSSPSLLGAFRPLNALLAALTAAALTIPGFAMPDALSQTDQALLYLAGIVLVAEHFGFFPSLLYAVLASLFFNLLFIEPAFYLSVDKRDSLVTFAMMIATGFFVARRSSLLRARAESAHDRENKTRALYALTRSLAAARGRFPVSDVVAQFIDQTYDLDATVWMTNSEGHPSVVLGELPETTYYKDFGALQWCLENAQNAGRGTSTMPSADGFYLPLLSAEGSLGVMGLFPRQKERIFTSEEISSFETLASLLASALERVRAGEIAAQVMIEKEGGGMPKIGQEAPSPVEASFVSSLRKLHLEGASSLKTEPDDKKAPESVLQDAKMARNILAFFNREHGNIGGNRLNRRPASVLDRIERAKGTLAASLKGRRIELDVPSDLPDVLIDVSLVEQLLSDILLLALKRSPPKGDVVLRARREKSDILVSVADKGPFLSDPQIESLFEAFSADPGAGGVQESPPLSVPAGIVRLHGGEIKAQSQTPLGLQISFTLPIA